MAVLRLRGWHARAAGEELSRPLLDVGLRQLANRAHAPSYALTAGSTRVGGKN